MSDGQRALPTSAQRMRTDTRDLATCSRTVCLPIAVLSMTHAKCAKISSSKVLYLRTLKENSGESGYPGRYNVSLYVDGMFRILTKTAR